MTDAFDDDDDELDVDAIARGERQPYDADGLVEPSHRATRDDDEP